MLLDIQDFGAVPDGVTDSRAAIQAAIDDAVRTGAAGVLVPAGTYRVSRAPSPARWSLLLSEVDGFVVAGEGPRSVIRLVDTAEATGDWHVLAILGSRRVHVRDLVVDGNRTGLAAPDEQSHGIEVEPGTEDLTVERCVLRECFGDGVRLLGAAGEGGNLRRIRLESCLFQGNHRSGLGIQRALEQVVVHGCFFDDTVADQSIDFEPSGNDGPSDLVIANCVINHTNPTPAVTLSGISGPDPAVRVKLVDNLILGGRVFSTDVRQLTVQGNVIVVPEQDPPANHIALNVQRGGDTLAITGNVLVNEGSAAEATLALSEVNQRPVRRALVSGNTLVSRSGNGIQVMSGDDVTVSGNLVVSSGTGRQAVLARGEASDLERLSVHDNTVTVRDGGTWAGGVRIAATDPHRVSGLSVTGNTINGAAEGISFAGNGFATTPVCALNRVDGDVPALVGLRTLPEAAVVVGGAAGVSGGTGTGAARWLATVGDPNGRVTGRVGDVAQRLDGTPGATLYVKESDAAPTTGWTPK